MDAKERVKASVGVVQKNITIGAQSKLSLSDIKKFCMTHATIALDKRAYVGMRNSYDFLETYIDKRVPIYGINTQFGDQVYLLENCMHDDVNAYYQAITQRQENLIRSHACGMGDTAPSAVVKTAMLLRAHCLAQGYSGVSLEVVETIIACLNAGIVPIVPKYGSIGASGDLIPLATIAAALIGENIAVNYKDAVMLAPEALALANIKKISVKMRDGLAMINGTSFMTAIASVSLCDLKRLFNQMLNSIGMALEAMLAVTSAYHPLVHHLKRQAGQIDINRFLCDFWQGSQLLSELGELEKTIDDKKVDPSKRIQNYYSLRSVAQGFGPFKENLDKSIVWIENEMNSVNDNPVIDLVGKRLLNNANFMGYYVTDACDILKMNIAQASTWIHALLANLVHPRKNCNLPANLVENPQTHNGFRPLQLLAASLAVQNRKLAQAQQAYSLPTEGDNQDVNSLGVHAALDFREAVENLERLTAILTLAAVQALEFRGFEKAGSRTRDICQVVRQHSPTIKKCRSMQNELMTIVGLLRDEKI
jgi:histidine ammonia-lyase